MFGWFGYGSSEGDGAPVRTDFTSSRFAGYGPERIAGQEVKEEYITRRQGTQMVEQVVQVPQVQLVPMPVEEEQVHEVVENIIERPRYVEREVLTGVPRKEIRYVDQTVEVPRLIEKQSKVDVPEYVINRVPVHSKAAPTHEYRLLGTAEPMSTQRYICLAVMIVLLIVLCFLVWGLERVTDLPAIPVSNDLVAGSNPVFATTHPAALKFDCDAGYWNWEKGWSVEKKHWCCDYHGRGCPHHTTSLPYDCDAGYANWEKGWSLPKKDWCCQHAHRGCHVVAPPVLVSTEPYDCLAGLANSQGGWSPGKKLWCCHVKNLGCYTTTAMPYDCQAGLSNWQAGWSAGKKSWCCSHENLGCHVFVKVSDPYDCDAGFSNWQAGWSTAKKHWCCSNVNRGCEEHASYDCDAGYSNWEKGWSEPKKIWCCARHQRGCPSTSLSPLGCHAACSVNKVAATCRDRIQFSAIHDFAHKENACGQAYSKVQVECDICRACSIQASECHGLDVTFHSTSKPFDCQAGFSNWKAGWSSPKKAWCCHNEHKACEEAAPTSYDCQAGLSNFHSGWSQPKKYWCCDKQGLGCEGPSAPTVPAGSGFYWKHVQMNGFWTWVRAHTSELHAAPNYDCDAGLASFKMGWSDDKKLWCCKHEHKGCA